MVLGGLQVISIADDILIPGCGATEMEAELTTTENLSLYLSNLRNII